MKMNVFNKYLNNGIKQAKDKGYVELLEWLKDAKRADGDYTLWKSNDKERYEWLKKMGYEWLPFEQWSKTDLCDLARGSVLKKQTLIRKQARSVGFKPVTERGCAIGLLIVPKEAA